MAKKKKKSSGSFKIVKYKQSYKSGKFNKKTINRIGFFLDKKPISVKKLSELTKLTKDEILYQARENTDAFSENMKIALDSNYTMVIDYNKINLFEKFNEFKTDSGKVFNSFDEFNTYYSKYLNDNFGHHFFGNFEFEIQRTEKDGEIFRTLVFDDVTKYSKQYENKFIRGGKDFIITSTK